MKRPVRHFDFLLLTPWEYCLKHSWYMMLLSVAVSIPISIRISQTLEASPIYAYAYDSGMLDGASVTLLFFALCNIALFFCLYQAAKWSMKRKEAVFMRLYALCVQNVSQPDGGTDAMREEFYTYQAARAAASLLRENKARAELMEAAREEHQNGLRKP